jgi:hypothetical protein
VGGKTMKRDAGDILDRLSISKLKVEKDYSAERKREYELFTDGFNQIKFEHKGIDWDQCFLYMYRINGLIWETESNIRLGMLDNNIHEVGRRAILVRKLNSLRVGFKNIINKLVNEGTQDIKINHLSQ